MKLAYSLIALLLFVNIFITEKSMAIKRVIDHNQYVIDSIQTEAIRLLLMKVQEDYK